MRFIFCSEPFSPAEPDFAYRSEAEIVRQKGFQYELFSFEDLTNDKVSTALRRIRTGDEPEIAIYRGWMLKPEKYENLYNELKKKNIILINSPEEYKHCHYLPESYDLIKDHTPKSLFFPLEENFNFDDLMERLTVFGDRSLILKDYVKSRKHEWNEACFIPNASNRKEVERVVNRFIELQGDDLNRGLVFREFIDFQPLTDHSKSGMPLTKEFRLFFFAGDLIFSSEYWEEGTYQEKDHPEDVFAHVARNVRSNFFTMDIAQKTDGQWMVVELGDGQVAGLPENADVSDFYDSLGLHSHELWRQDDNGHKFLVETFACKVDATKAMREFEDCGHKQIFWVEKSSL